MPKKALIFGITGQDGSFLGELLLLRGYDVYGVTRRVSVDTTQRISSILPDITILEGDITDRFCVSNVINKVRPDEIYNLAAQSHVATSFTQPSLTWEVVANGCLNILEALRSLDLCLKVKFYQASSSEMFGRNYSVDAEGNKYQDEDTSFKPQSPYAVAKLAAHHLVDNYRRSYGVFGCSGILFNHESERRGEQFVTRKITKWISEFVRWKESIPNDCLFSNSVDGDSIQCWKINGPNIDDQHLVSEFKKLRLGNLDARRDWGHAEDYVRAMWLMLQQDKADDYVISTEKTHTVRDFLDVSFNVVGVKDWSNLVVIDPLFYRPSEVDYLLGKCTKAKELLGWSPSVSFEELARRMVEHDINEEKLRRSNIQAF